MSTIRGGFASAPAGAESLSNQPQGCSVWEALRLQALSTARAPLLRPACAVVRTYICAMGSCVRLIRCYPVTRLHGGQCAAAEALPKEPPASGCPPQAMLSSLFGLGVGNHGRRGLPCRTGLRLMLTGIAFDKLGEQLSTKFHAVSTIS